MALDKSSFSPMTRPQMTRAPMCPDKIRAACEVLGTRDAALFKAFTLCGPPQWRDVDTGFESLTRIVVFQLLSIRAASTIWARLLQAFDGTLTVEKIAASTPEILRSVGLSNAKANCVRGLALAMRDDGLCLHFEEDISQAQASLLALRGIGPWTANIYCMTALKDMNAFPVGDVGLMEAYRMLRGDAARMDAKTFNDRAQAWAPYRGVAAHLLWAWINTERGLQATD